MKINNSINVNNYTAIYKDKGAQNKTLSNTCCEKNITELPISSANEIYFKGRLQKHFSGQDIINLLQSNGYVQNDDGFVKDFSEKDRLNLIFTFYPEMGANYENDKDNIDYLINNQYLYKDFLKFAYTTEEVCRANLNQVDIKKLTDFANLDDGKIGEFLKKDFDYTMFIFKLMNHNGNLDTVLELSQKEPTVLAALHQVLSNKPSLSELKAVNTYKSLSAFTINASLRGKAIDEDTLNSSLRTAKILDAYLDKFVIKEPMQLIRSDHLSILNSMFINNKEILLKELFAALQSKDKARIDKICSRISHEKPIVLNRGYISTSLDKDMNRKIRWSLTVAPGVKGVYADLLNLLSKETSDENEILLQRDTVFKITKFYHDEEDDQIVINAIVYPNKFL